VSNDRWHTQLNLGKDPHRARYLDHTDRFTESVAMQPVPVPVPAQDIVATVGQTKYHPQRRVVEMESSRHQMKASNKPHSPSALPTGGNRPRYALDRRLIGFPIRSERRRDADKSYIAMNETRSLAFQPVTRHLYMRVYPKVSGLSYKEITINTR
jgi:hypothetical protein